MQKQTGQSWVDSLDDEDLAFVKRFILASGSLKELAGVYGVSYPTIRLRLDRLIEKIKIHDDARITTEFERRLRTLYAEGRIDVTTLSEILAAYGKEEESK